MGYRVFTFPHRPAPPVADPAQDRWARKADREPWELRNLHHDRSAVYIQTFGDEVRYLFSHDFHCGNEEY